MVVALYHAWRSDKFRANETSISTYMRVMLNTLAPNGSDAIYTIALPTSSTSKVASGLLVPSGWGTPFAAPPPMAVAALPAQRTGIRESRLERLSKARLTDVKLTCCDIVFSSVQTCRFR
jgi:hypothetical protein